MARNCYDETWHRLREWTKGQTPSERLAAQILLQEGFSNFDPSHSPCGRGRRERCNCNAREGSGSRWPRTSREDIKTLATPTVVELYHLERITAILDAPGMAKIREQFLDIEAESPPSIYLGGEGGLGLGSGGGGGASGPDATGGSGRPWAVLSTFTGAPVKRQALAVAALARLARVQSVARVEAAANTPP